MTHALLASLRLLPPLLTPPISQAFARNASLLRQSYVYAATHGSVAEVDRMFMVTTAQMRSFLMEAADTANNAVNHGTCIMETSKNDDRSQLDLFLEESRKITDSYEDWEVWTRI